MLTLYMLDTGSYDTGTYDFFGFFKPTSYDYLRDVCRHSDFHHAGPADAIPDSDRLVCIRVG